MAIKISALPLFIGNATSTGDIPISIGGITYRVKSNQLNTFSLVGNSAVITDGSGNLTTSLVSSTELFALDGITGNVQTQLNAIVASIPTGTTSQVQDVIVDGVTGFAPSQNAVYDALVLKANTVSPAFGGIPTTPTPASGDSSLQIANTQFVMDNITGITNNIQNSLVYDGTGTKIPTVDAVNDTLTKLSLALINTGFADLNDNFSLYVVDPYTIGINGSTGGVFYKSLLETSPYILSESILEVPTTTLPLSGLGLTGDGKYVKFLGYTDLETFQYDEDSFFTSSSVAQLGILLLQVSGGVTTFLTNSSGVITSPSIAAYDNFESTVIGVSTSVNVIPSANTLSVINTEGSIKGISVNWDGGGNNDELPVSANTPVNFFQVSPIDLTTPAALTATTIVDTTRYYSGGTLVTLTTSGSAVIHRFIMTINGHFYLQYGELEYSDLTDAANHIDIATYNNILPINSYVEVTRLAVIKGATDLNDTNQAIFRSIKTSTGGIGGGGTWGTINGNINDQFDLQAQFATKFGGSGTTNILPKYFAPGVLVESNLLDNGVVISAATDMRVNEITLGRGLGNNIESTVFGYNSLGNTTSAATNNAAFGAYVLQNNIISSYNSALGAYALNALTGGGFNTVFGFFSMGQSIAGYNNTAFGYYTLTNCEGSENTAIGDGAVTNLQTGVRNTGIGSGALGGLVDGNDNVGIGSDAGRLAPVGDGSSMTNSIYIGRNSKGSSSVANNEIVIGANAIGFSSDTIVLGGFTNKTTYISGNLLLGRTNYVEFYDNNIDRIQVSGTVMSMGFKKSGGTSSEYLMADGSVSTAIFSGSGSANTITKWSSNSGLTYSTLLRDNGTAFSINTTATTATMNLQATAIVGRESVFQAMVSDNAVDKIMIANGTSTAGRFAPGFVGYTEGGYGAIFFRGLGSATDDLSGNTPYVTFLAANTSSSSDPNNGTLTVPTARPLFSFGSNNTYMSMFAGGNLLLQNGGTFINNGVDRLQVNGSIVGTSIKKSGGTNSQFLMADGTVTEYKEYSAVINTTGTTIAPAVLYNTIGAIVWTNIGTGRWQGVLTGAFPLNKCTLLANNGNGSALGIVNVFRLDDNTIRLQTYDLTGVGANDIINQGSLTVKVFP